MAHDVDALPPVALLDALETLAAAQAMHDIAASAPLLAAALGAVGVELGVIRGDRVLAIGPDRGDDGIADASPRLAEVAQRGAEWWPESTAGAVDEPVWAYLPLPAGAVMLGAVGLAFTARRFAAHDRHALRAVARHIAVAVDRAGQFAGLRDAVRITDEVVGILGHDLRNPLHAIILTIDTLLSDHANEPLARFLVRMRNSAERMARLIDQLLNLAKMRLGGGVELQPERMDLAALIRQHIDEVQPGAVQVIELEVRGDGRGRWDRDRLSQVVVNLLGNAAAHGSHDAPIQVELDGSADEVLVSVWNGGAIPPELLPVIFEPFRGSQDPRKGGLGLGLAIASQIVAAHGGTLTVRSSLLDGTTFVVALPRAAPGAT
jgi:signal transduction histidine kinase